MKKILWLHNMVLTDASKIQNGSWVQSLVEQIQELKIVQVCYIAMGDVKEVVRQDYKNIPQWIIPFEKEFWHNYKTSKKTCETIARIEAEIQPDLVHIWGAESIWCSVYCQGYLKSPVLLDMQGLLSQYYYYYYGGLAFKELLKCIHLKEILLPWRTLFHKMKNFRKRGELEVGYLKQIKNIAVQSEWVRNHVRIVNPQANLYKTNLMIRRYFYEAKKWEFHPFGDAPVIYSACNAAESYKGIHVLLKALVVLKRKYPNIQLRLAGTILVGNRLMDGYSVYLKKIIKQNRLENNVRYLGRLNGEQMVSELQQANVCVVPSFVETYCLVFAEAMAVGTPTVVSYAGAMPELARHGEEAMFYNSIDYGICATYIDELLQNKTLAEALSSNARQRKIRDNNPDFIVRNQLAIYDAFFERNK